MRVSLRTDQALKVLEYVKGLELRSGGIAGWKGAPAYPEVSGYLIPTLIHYGEFELAVRIADWLVSIQNEDGSFDDMYGQKRSFDTSAVMEGLKDYQLFSISGNDDYYQVATRADQWLSGMVREDGAVRTTLESDETHLYTMRVSWLLGSEKGARYWKSQEWPDTREHYVAYALEGLWKMGEEEFVKKKLMERDWVSDDLCANAQFCILWHLEGNPSKPIQALVKHQAGMINNSWTAKWILDMWKVVGD